MIINLGPAPHDEPCAQVGRDGFEELNRQEIKRYIAQLKRMFAPIPDGVEFVVVRNDHDFGTYSEAGLEFNDADPVQLEYARKVEAGLPGKWDDGLTGTITVRFYRAVGWSKEDHKKNIATLINQALANTVKEVTIKWT